MQGPETGQQPTTLFASSKIQFESHAQIIGLLELPPIQPQILFCEPCRLSKSVTCPEAAVGSGPRSAALYELVGAGPPHGIASVTALIPRSRNNPE